MSWRVRLILLSCVVLVVGNAGCSSKAASDRTDDIGVLDGAAEADAEAPCLPGNDSDGDGLSDVLEGCLEGRDTDGDGTPDYLDVDSDGDSLLDRDEDRNGDGLLGCCIQRCGKPEGAQVAGLGQPGCKLNSEGCGSNQVCVEGRCDPPVHRCCAGEETNPRRKDTFGDGKFDNERGAFLLCCEDLEPAPGSPVLRLRSADPAQSPGSANWQLALGRKVDHRALGLPAPVAREAALTLDYRGAEQEVAGFLVSLPPLGDDLGTDLAAVLARLRNTSPLGALLTQRSGGARGRSHDGFEIVRNLDFELELPPTAAPRDVGAFRDTLIANWLGLTASELAHLPPAHGVTTHRAVLRFSLVRRFAFEVDKGGHTVVDQNANPVEDWKRPGERQLLLIGAVATLASYQDPWRPTARLVKDLANGTALATHADEVLRDCDWSRVAELPVADILWVIDEELSPSRRQQLVAHANSFFARGLASGLDFRMGVTGMCAPGGASCTPGAFCSTQPTDPAHPGVDRFLLPTEHTLFADCVRRPPGDGRGEAHGLDNVKAAIARHLPRRANQRDKVRVGAELVVIVVSDRPDHGVAALLPGADQRCLLPGAERSKLDAHLAPLTDLLAGLIDPEASATVHHLGAVCGGCGALAHGYSALAATTGGLVGDICSADPGPTLQSIIDGVAGKTSPIPLERQPISSSLQASVDGLRIARSETNGFRYDAEANSLVLTNTKFKKGSEVMVTYLRWSERAKLL